MNTNKFSSVATTEINPNWEKLTNRKTQLYSLLRHKHALASASASFLCGYELDTARTYFGLSGFIYRLPWLEREETEDE